MSITADQMREVDRAMVEDYGIQLAQMMENAGRSLAHLARRRLLGGDPRDARVLVLAGRGGNGGGGTVCARRLHNWGADVHVVTAAPSATFQGVPAQQLQTLRSMGIQVIDGSESPELPAADLIVDALIGYSLRGAPAGLVMAANSHGAPILSLDVPSGVDATTGRVHDPAIRATATLTLALPKTGLDSPDAVPNVGELYLGRTSVSPASYMRAGESG